MNGKQLKNSILQWAIQGKLVPQDPHDEPASVLLERIREEKARLVKEKKIKKDKNESIIFRGDDNSHYEKFLATGEVKCIDDEIPFEIPEGWEWCRFGTIMINRDCERIPLSVSQRQHLDKIYDYYGASGVIDKVDKYLFDRDLLLIGEDGANLINRSTPIAFIASGKYWVNNHAHVLDVCGGLNLKYIALFINAISLVDYVTGTAQPKMNQEKMNSILVAVPPKEEQIRILNRFSIIEPLIDRYNLKKRTLEQLNSSIYSNLRKSILQEAIQGKLVPQDPNDEPASVLLERIREEKQRLLKEGKLKKKDITDSVIFKGEDNKYYERLGKSIIEIDEHIPFNIPESWEWTTLDFVSYSVGSRANQVQSKEILKEGYYPVVSQGLSLIDGYVNDGSKIIKDLPVILFGDHTRNVKYIDFPFVIGADGTKLHKAIGVYPQYLFLWMLYAANTLRDRGYARHYSLLRKTYIPLPPYKEQIRIVKKYDTALASIMSR